MLYFENQIQNFHNIALTIGIMYTTIDVTKNPTLWPT